MKKNTLGAAVRVLHHVLISLRHFEGTPVQQSKIYHWGYDIARPYCRALDAAFNGYSNLPDAEFIQPQHQVSDDKDKYPPFKNAPTNESEAMKNQIL